jgi:ribosomal-protein-alanine N-acetyltransferase
VGNEKPPLTTVIGFATRQLVGRLLAPSDLQRVVAYQRENAEFFAPTSPRRSPDFLSEDYWRQQIERDREDARADRHVRFYLISRDDPDGIVGHVSLTNIARGPAQYCDLGYGIAKDREGQELMTEGVAAAIRFAFDDLRLHRVKAAYLPTNERSGRLLRRLGFVVEGYARDYLQIQGTWQDMILSSLLNPDWRADEQSTGPAAGVGASGRGRGHPSMAAAALTGSDAP